MKTVKHKIACILLATFAASAAFADDPYIASTADGTFYAIDTGFVPGPDTKIFADFEFVGDVASIGKTYGQIVFEATSADNGYARIYITGGGNVAWAFTETNGVDNSHWVSTGIDMEVGKRYTMYIDSAAGETVFTYDGKSKTMDFPGGNTATIQATNSIMLFANRSKKNSAMMKLYHFKIWEAETLVHDYVAAKRDGENGLYDYATGVFRPDDGLNEAAGNAPFDYGGDLQDVGTGWLESDGTVAFDSGYYFNADSRIEVDFSFTTPENGKRIWGASTDTSVAMSAFYQNGSGNFSFLSGSGGTTPAYYSLGIKADTERHTAIYDVPGGKAYLITGDVTNKTATLAAGAAPAAQSTIPIGIFADCNNANGKSFSNHYSKSRIYRIKFSTDGHPEENKDFIPYVKEGVPGFKDTISGEFIESATAGVPTYGGNIAGEQDAYLESDGTQGINTGYYMKNTTRVEIDFAYTDISGSATRSAAFGAYSCSNNKATLFIASNGQVRMRNDTNTGAKTVADAADCDRHKAIIDGPNKTLSYDSTTVKSGNIGTKDAEHPMGVFAGVGDANGITFQIPAKMRLYSFRIYETENNVETLLVHEYLPYKGADGTLGLFDTVNPSAVPLVDTYTAGDDAAFVYGGKGVEGAEKWLVVPQNCTITKTQGTATLTANASGAVSYRWTKNDEAIEGGEDGVLDVAWRRGGKTDTYAVAPVYELYGVTKVGESVSCEVENVPLGMMVIIR